ncbi:ABC transporter permease [Dawidia soli]|uniref:ABC transporter permease n=1 Tax=Dawidia soli TaxID=2782352 RepID=A0AAP2GI90_9BACT|nr:ABC transporter permease [Dawidia soli]MBT1688026.1 ABC transporter permease [Dawidia soli]
MLFTNLKSAWRNLLRHPFSSAINIAGLATGITCCIFIALYIVSELQADSMHVHRDAIFRVNYHNLESGRSGMLTAYPLGTVLQSAYGEVEKVVRLGQDNVSIRANNDAYFFEKDFYWADSTFFDVFSYKLLQGDPATALQKPNSLVMTQAMAAKYFAGEDPIGKVVELKIYDGDRKFDFTVTGIVENPPRTASVQFEFLAPMSTALKVYPQFESFWGLHWVYTFVLTNNPASFQAKQAGTTTFFKKYTGDNAPNVALEFQPLHRIHLHSGHVDKNLSDGINNIYVFAAIGIFIFLLACVNFVNLSTARAEERRKEIGVRKALGAFRPQLFAQFMLEALLTATIVLIISFAATTAFLPLADAYIDSTTIMLPALTLPLAFLGIMLLIALCAGLYPAVFLSAFNALDALKSRTSQIRGTSVSVRQVLVVFQFTISIALIAGTLIINKQVHYLKQADLGFTVDQLITIPVDDRQMQKKLIAIRDYMATSPGIQSAAVSGEGFPAAMNYAYNVSWQGLPADDHRSIFIIAIDANYLKLLQASFLEGRNLSPDFMTDDSASVIINEAARQWMGGGEVVGKEITLGTQKRTIVGVVKDIHHYSLHQKVAPIAYFPIPPGDRTCPDNLVLRVTASSLPATLASLKEKWETLTQDRPFEYHFVDQGFEETYAQEEKFLMLFQVFSALAIVIACLGLMGLSSFVVNKRSKEIGIRKVLGASASQILVMLTRGFSLPIVIAFVLAAPVIYFGITPWLDKFAYRISVDWLLIILAGLSAWGVAFAFIGIQSWKAARVNPVETLRDE